MRAAGRVARPFAGARGAAPSAGPFAGRSYMPVATAQQIIKEADREHAADRVLRQVLKAERMTPDDAKEVSRLVYAYYRWRGWVPHREKVPAGDVLKQALALAERFAAEPRSFSDQELLDHAVPSWLRNEMEVTPALVRALQAEPRVWLRVRKELKISGLRPAPRAGLPGRGLPIAAPQAFAYEGKDDLFSLPGFHSGAFEMQDLSSQLVTLACEPRPGETWWDACAGEGGKTIYLSDLMQNKGSIWASDRAEWRLSHLKRRAARAEVFNYRSVRWEGGLKLPTRTLFDGVLVDAPCSGVGTWGRNPHARWTATPQDISELAEVQVRLLLHASKGVKPGGKLVYSVCSLTRKETEEVIRNVGLGLGPGWSTAGEPMVIRPQDYGSNGMFISGWRKG